MLLLHPTFLRRIHLKDLRFCPFLLRLGLDGQQLIAAREVLGALCGSTAGIALGEAQQLCPNAGDSLSTAYSVVTIVSSRANVSHLLVGHGGGDGA